MSMFRRVFTAPCLRSIVSLLRHVYGPTLTGGFYVPSTFHRVYIPGSGLELVLGLELGLGLNTLDKR